MCGTEQEYFINRLTLIKNLLLTSISKITLSIKKF